MKMVIAYQDSEKYRKRKSYLNYLNSLNEGTFKFKIVTDLKFECKAVIFYKVKKKAKKK